MINKIISIFILGIVFFESNLTFSQQLPIYQHSFLIRSAYNPAEVLNKTSDLSVYILRGDQFSRFDGGFVNNYLNFSSPLRSKNIGIGFELANRSYGIINQLSAGLTYAYRAKITKNSNITLGLRLGFMEHKFNKYYLVIYQDLDPVIENIPRDVVIPNGNFGVTLNTKFGSFEVSIPQLLSNRFLSLSSNSQQNIILAPHLFTRYSVDIGFNKDYLKLTPVISLRYLPNTIYQLEAGITAWVDDKVWINANYRSKFSASLGVGVKLFDSWMIGYSHDRPIQNTYSFYNSSNEVVLGYTFNKDKSKPLPPVTTRDYGRGTYDYGPAPENSSNARVKMDSVSSVTDPEIAKEYLKFQLSKSRLEDSLDKIANDKSRGLNYKSLLIQINLVDSLFESEITSNQKTVNSQRNNTTSDDSETSIIDNSFKSEKEIAEDKLLNELNENREEKIKIVRNTQPNEKVYVELSGEDSPRGYYLITGVFSTLERAQKFRWQDGTENSKIMINKKNKYFYVVQSYAPTKSIGDLKNIILEYRSKNKPIWILDY
jgi:type IX secretion system PorP/SprF family membrane protein